LDIQLSSFPIEVIVFVEVGEDIFIGVEVFLGISFLVTLEGVAFLDGVDLPSLRATGVGGFLAEARVLY